MPIYEFKCHSCGEVLETFRAIHDSNHGIKCPDCGGEDIQRIMSRFSTKDSTSQSCNINIPT